MTKSRKPPKPKAQLTPAANLTVPSFVTRKNTDNSNSLEKNINIVTRAVPSFLKKNNEIVEQKD